MLRSTVLKAAGIKRGDTQVWDEVAEIVWLASLTSGLSLVSVGIAVALASWVEAGTVLPSRVGMESNSHDAQLWGVPVGVFFDSTG